MLTYINKNTPKFNQYFDLKNNAYKKCILCGHKLKKPKIIYPAYTYKCNGCSNYYTLIPENCIIKTNINQNERIRDIFTEILGISIDNNLPSLPNILNNNLINIVIGIPYQDINNIRDQVKIFIHNQKERIKFNQEHLIELVNI